MDERAIGRFVGSWRAEDGRRLTIRATPRGALVDASDAAGAPYRINVLGLAGLLAPKSVRLPAVLEGGQLVVEAGSPGLGPTLRLALLDLGGREALVPEVRMGLYDDFDDDLGVPWMTPLAPFFRALES